MARSTNTVYLLHFDRPYHHARHYIGCTSNLAQRLRDHRAGRGARLMEVIVQAGISFRVARVWDGGRTVERKLKDRKNAGDLCPICKQKRDARRWRQRSWLSI